MCHAMVRRAPIALLALAVLCLAVPSLWAQQPDDNPWPHQIEAPSVTVTMYQPQLEAFEGNTLTARAAVAVDTGGTEPVFGAVWMTAQVQTDRDDRTVALVSLDVTQVRFPESTEQHEQALASLLESEIPQWSLSLSLDRLQASLALVESQQRASAALNTTPPVIRFVDHPAILVMFDGEPNLQQAGDGLMVAVNTPFVVLLDVSQSTWYLYAGPDAWYEGYDALGPWNLSQNVPAYLADIVPDSTQTPAAQDQAATDGGAPPKIVTATVSTELISSRGTPTWQAIDSTSLESMSNTDSDVLRLGSTYFVLLSGRWYSAGSFAGPWTYLPSDSLPADFSQIPADSDEGYLRAFVAGTDEARDAMLDSQIPQTATLKRSAATIDVHYDGNPRFVPIDSTDLHYGVNTATPVILADDTFYACEGAAWYVSAGATGPWALADSIPDEIYSMPPSSPVYNCRFVYVFDATEDEVDVGYYPGYGGSYVYETTVVYGTGWYYNPWYGRVYYGWPRTWGFHMQWNPWTGWSVGLGFHNGPFTFGFGGPWARPGCCWGGWWGPAGFRGGYGHGYSRGARAGFAAGYGAGQRNNIYRQPRHQARNAQMNQSRRSATSSVNRPNNVYTDPQGNVHRRNANGTWDQRSQGSWQQRQPQAAPSAARRATPNTKQRDLDKQHQARQQGTARTQQAQRSRSTARRGGGRRR
jgi:hypothetical protein